MPNRGPSEFGGHAKTPAGVQPPPHVPTPSERLSLAYRSGDESGLTKPDSGEAFSGLLPFKKQKAKREAEGVLRHGEEWDRLQAEGQIAVNELKTASE